MIIMTRLEILLKLHGQQGGTIHEFNRMYKVDFLKMSENDFAQFIGNLILKRGR